MGNRPESEEKLLIPALFLSQLSTRPIGILMGFILTDIALTFNTTVGTAGQIVTAASFTGLIISPFLAVLSIKIPPRKLLLLGEAAITISAIGCSFASDYISMLLMYSVSGLGAAIVTPMILTIIGEKIIEDKRAGIIGLIMASTPMLSTLAGLLISYVVREGWQNAFRFYVFPILLMTLIFTFFILPQTSNTISTVENTGYMDLFKKIVGYRSALACLLGSILTTIASGGIIWYFISFYKETFGISTAIVGLIWSVNTFVNVVGSLLCGKIIPRFGNKFVTYVSSIFIGLSIVFLIHVQNYLLAIVIGLFFPFFSALWGASSNALALKQVPEYKGAMMSLNMGATQLGRSLGSFIGGVALNIGGYSLMGITFCIVSLLAFLIVYFISLEN